MEKVLNNSPAWVRAALVCVASVALIYAVFAVGVANITESSAPNIALRFQPMHAKALGNAAYAALAENNGDPSSRAVDLAKRAIARDPTSVAAARTLGLVAASRNEVSAARSLMNYSSALSRRDLTTHLWMIEDYVAQDDLNNALAHYDMALRTSRLAAPILLPILVSATADDRIIKPLESVLAGKPSWGNAFLQELIASGPSIDNVARLAIDLSNRGAPLDIYERLRLTNRLIAEKRFYEAAMLMGRDRRGPSVLSPDFQETNGIGPFFWALKSNYDFGAEHGLKAGSNDDFVLSVFASHERGGEVARQLLLLGPGQYRLHSRATGIALPGNNLPYWRVACAGKARNSADLLRLELSYSAQSGAVDEFVVPSGDCEAQWLVLMLPAPANREGLKAEVQEVDISAISIN